MKSNKFKMPDITNKLVCPDCRKNLAWKSLQGTCLKCSRKFRFKDRNITLLPKNFKDIKWLQDEMSFWEQEYKTHKRIKAKSELPKLSNRLKIRAEMISFLLNRKIINPGCNILDIGSGDGYTSFYLLNPDKYRCTYVAIDASSNALKLLRDKMKTPVTIQGVVEKIPFKDKLFDVIFIWGCLHHAEKKEKLLLDLKKLLKKDGYILMYEPLEPTTWFLRTIENFGKKLTRESDHEERLSEKKMNKVVKSSFKVLWSKKDYSPIRTPLVLLFGKLGWLDNSRIAGNLTVGIDTFVIRTLGKYFATFSGRAVGMILSPK